MDGIATRSKHVLAAVCDRKMDLDSQFFTRRFCASTTIEFCVSKD